MHVFQCFTFPALTAYFKCVQGARFLRKCRDNTRQLYKLCGLKMVPNNVNENFSREQLFPNDELYNLLFITK